LPGRQLEHEPDQGIAQVDQLDVADRAGVQLAQPCDLRAAAAPAVGGQVVQRPARVPLGIAVHPVPVLEEPLERRLRQVLSGLPATGQQLRRAQQCGAALGQERLKLVNVSGLNASGPFVRGGLSTAKCVSPLVAR
jgi:hypothetical protein